MTDGGGVGVGAVAGHFVATANGPLFVLLREPSRAERSCILVVPPFAEEMNKCRRMVTEAALGLAGQGIGTIAPDLFGTGDSGGDLADADWARWQGDLATTASWATTRGLSIKGILAIRLGCALAASVGERGLVGPVAGTVFWQPVFDGRRHLAQFLRLSVAAGMMEAGRRESLDDLRARLGSGEVLEVAGYGLSRRLAANIEGLVLPPSLPRQLGRVDWMEITRNQDDPLPAPSAKLAEASKSAGSEVVVQKFVGEPFWASTEIVTLRDVIDATVSALASCSRVGIGA